MQVISKSELLQTLKEIQCQMYRARIDGVGAVSWFSDIVNEQPVIEAAPVIHAKWIYEDSERICSHCRSAILYELDNQGDAICEEWPWCAKCGAKMDLE